MARPDPILTDWLKNAYSIEIGLIPVLERQTSEARSDPEIQKRTEQHLEQTRRHANLLKGCLERFGENTSAIRPIAPIFQGHTPSGGSTGGASTREQWFDYVEGSFEVASYQVLLGLAEKAGDTDTAHVAQQILRDEMDMVNRLGQRLPGDGKAAPSRPSSAAVQHGAQPGAYEGTPSEATRLANQVFDALNAHDLDRAQGYLAPDAQTELSTRTTPLNRETLRTWVQSFLTAFPDVRYQVLRTFGSGNYATLVYTATGTHTGPLVSLEGQQIPPTRRKVSTPSCVVFETRGDKIARQWIYFDTGLLMEQLGLAPGQVGAPQPGTSGARQPSPGQGNRALALDYVEALNAHDFGRMERQFAADFEGYQPGAPGPLDRAGTIAYLRNFTTAFPDLHFDTRDTVEQGDMVVMHWNATGTHNGPLQGPDGRQIPPTHKRAEGSGIQMFKFKNGKIQQGWSYWDMANLMRQLGLMPGS